jgi:hypothetical protein
MKKLEIRKRSNGLSVYKIKQAGDEKWTKKQTHKLITSLPPLNSDEMGSNDSKAKQNNATTKMVGQGYSSEDNYQSCRKCSQGK